MNIRYFLVRSANNHNSLLVHTHPIPLFFFFFCLLFIRCTLVLGLEMIGLLEEASKLMEGSEPDLDVPHPRSIMLDILLSRLAQILECLRPLIKRFVVKIFFRTDSFVLYPVERQTTRFFVFLSSMMRILVLRCVSVDLHGEWYRAIEPSGLCRFRQSCSIVWKFYDYWDAFLLW